jgi:hypothetical protein
MYAASQVGQKRRKDRKGKKERKKKEGRGFEVKGVRKSEEKRTRHLAYTFADAPTHTHDADLPERVLVEPLGDKVARVLERKVEARRAHVAVRHRRREVQQEDEMADDRTAYRRGRREESEKEYIEVNVSRGMCVCVPGREQGEDAHLRRRPRASRSATAAVRLPASSSCTVSQERVYVASQA